MIMAYEHFPWFYKRYVWSHETLGPGFVSIGSVASWSGDSCLSSVLLRGFILNLTYAPFIVWEATKSLLEVEGVASVIS